MNYIALFLTGAAGYSLLEVLWRGYTHWTMSLCGGLCFIIIYFSGESMTEYSLWQKCMLGSAVITAVELLTGIIVNIILKWNVWDYSKIPLNFMGQICLPYSVLWFFLCFPIFGICKSMSKVLNF